MTACDGLHSQRWQLIHNATASGVGHCSLVIAQEVSPERFDETQPGWLLVVGRERGCAHYIAPRAIG